MHTLDWYLDTARERLKVPSDARLAPFLGITDNAISQWRTKRAWPRGPVMVKLAAICDVNAELALAELGAWREPQVFEWRSLVDRLGKTAAAIIAAMFIWPSGTPAHAGQLGQKTLTMLTAGTIDERPAAAPAETIHYATLISRVRSWICSQIGAFLTLATQRNRVVFM